VQIAIGHKSLGGQVAVLLSPTMSRTLLIVTRTLYRVLLTVTHDLHGALHVLQAHGGGGKSGLKRKNKDEHTHICTRCQQLVSTRQKTGGGGRSFETSTAHNCNGKPGCNTSIKYLQRIQS
jgi:hypothetical protein